MPSAPPAFSSAGDLLGSEEAASSVDQVALLRRRSPLAEDEVVTHAIGPLGGVITLPRAGFVVVFPPLAVSRPTSITVVAPAGDLVGYHFSPHGLDFAVPLTATQDLLLTEASTSSQNMATSLVAAYVQGTLAPTMDALEVLPLDVTGALGTFVIGHFSGYVVATN